MIELARDLLTQRGVELSPAPALAEMLRDAPARVIEDGDSLCTEGEDGDRMWVLVEGTVVVKKMELGGFPRRIATIDGPAMFGHMALAGGLPRSATCIADGELKVLLIDRARFDGLMADVGSVGDAFRRLLIAGMTRQLAQGNTELRTWLRPAFEDQATEQVDASELLSLHATFDGWVG
ncbi:MAG: cyclic nucleotide-binding domain-containing protein [Proteobacteria bacterium]|nr:cyclic nucleotide-binding domain-containing protein [Pseudomonadota bacterium]MCP4917728.1 cyclic nucleotide-binding domain-containing protein [Pseudomonadota bacterium]